MNSFFGSDGDVQCDAKFKSNNKKKPPAFVNNTVNTVLCYQHYTYKTKKKERKEKEAERKAVKHDWL